MSLCIVCRERKAVVPDRERMGRPIARVCRECHAERLRDDMRKILDLEEGRRREEQP